MWTVECGIGSFSTLAPISRGSSDATGGKDGMVTGGDQVPTLEHSFGGALRRSEGQFFSVFR
jgi:hypothetical protein